MRATELQSLLEELALKHEVPGASVAVFEDERITKASTGVINRNTGIEVTSDTLFQIASITKLYTATQIMQLVDDGKIELDRPVITYLPKLRFADARATESVTVRQLLCHTSGVAGDHYMDTGRGDDCLERFVATCATVPQLSPPGTMYSYCRAGYVILGRLVEEVTGQIWDTALKQRLLGQLGTQRTVTLPEDAIRHRVAVGHIGSDNLGKPTPVPASVFPRSTGPAGGIYSTASEALSFVRMHLDDGVARNGARLLSQESVWAMQQPQVECPNKWLANSRGIGWMILEWDGRKVIGHDGGGIGQSSFLRVVPEARFAVVLLTNTYTGIGLYRDLFKRLFAERVGIDVPDSPEADDGVDFEPSSYAGTYEHLNQRTQIEVQNGGLVATLEWGGVMRDPVSRARRVSMRPIDDTSFLIHLPGFETDLPVVFFDFDASGHPRYFHIGRAHRRIA